MADADAKYTARELEIMAAVMQCLKEGVPKPSQIDIPKLAAKVGMTEGSASVTWGKIKKKLTDDEGENPGAAPKTPGTGETKAKKTSAKRKSTAGETGDDKNETGETPSKKPRAKKVKTTVKGDDDVEALASNPAKKKAAPKKIVKADPQSPVAGSDDTVTNDTKGNTEAVDAGKDTIEVNGSIEVGENVEET